MPSIGPKKLMVAIRNHIRTFKGKGRFSLSTDIKPKVEEFFKTKVHNCKSPATALAAVQCTLQRMRDREGLFFYNDGTYEWPSKMERSMLKDIDVLDVPTNGHDRRLKSTTVLDHTNDPVFRALREAEASPPRRQLPNLERPIIDYVRADRFVLDLSENRQRDPILREDALKKQFGENGELFDFEKFEVVTALPREDGSLFPSAGMGRVWSIVNLLKRPDLEIPVLIKREVGDQKEKRAFVHSVTNAVPIKKAQLFMTLGNLTGKEYEIHRAIVQELARLGLTTIPGAGPHSITLTSAIFAARLGTLSEAYRLCRKWWFGDIVKSTGQYRHKVEGTALTAVAALLYTYGPYLDYDRLDQKFAGKDFNKFKADAIEACGNPTDQGRDDAPSVVKWMTRKYNNNPPKRGDGAFKKFTNMDFAETSQIREDFDRGAPLFKEMHDTWRMFDRADDDNE